MTRSHRHLARLVMRTAYTATGFFAAMLGAVISHDGVSPTGQLIPTEQPWIISAAVCWALACVLDGLTSEAGHK
jgi:hypothetical protein